MITLEIQDNNKNKIKQLLKLYKGKHDDLVSAMLHFKINDLKKGIRNIELDLHHTEESILSFESIDKHIEKRIIGSDEPELTDVLCEIDKIIQAT